MGVSGFILKAFSSNVTDNFEDISLTLIVYSFFASMFIGLSGIIAVQSYRVMRHHQTDIIFKNPTTNLVITGPFKFSRNPLYLSLLLLYTGVGVLLNSIWFAPLLLFLFIFLRRVVLSEEKLFYYLQDLLPINLLFHKPMEYLNTQQQLLQHMHF